MPSRGSKPRISAQGGFTLIEALLALLLSAVGTGVISDMLTGILKRSYITVEVTRVSDESDRFASSFTQAGKSATSWAIYANRAAYLADPVANVAVNGNILVFADQLADATVVTEIFEYDPVAQTLARYENNLGQQRSLLNRVLLTTGSATLFAQDLGLVQAHWTVQSAYELLDYEAYGTPLRMR
jgi:hypothetical protein